MQPLSTASVEIRALMKRAAYSLLLVTALLLCLWGAARTETIDRLLAPLDARAERYLEETLTKTAITYAAARAAHAVISVLQGTQVHPPFLTVAVGEALDPVRDLIERFSVLMLLSTASLGAQRILMELGQWIGPAVFAASGTFLLLGAVWIEHRRAVLMRWGVRLVLAGVLIRLLIPLGAWMAAGVSETLLETRYAGAMDQLSAERSALEESLELPAAQGGWLDRAKGWAEGEGISKKLDALKRKAEAIVTSLLTLFTLFVFETLIFPLLSLWLIVKLFNAALIRQT